MAKFERDLSVGSVPKLLITFALPLIVSTLIQNLYSAIDLVIVGQFAGTFSLSGVNNATNIVNLATNCAVGFCAGATVLIGRNLGAGNREEIKKTIGTLITFLFVVALVFTAVVQFFMDGIFALINTPAEALPEAKNYLRISAAGFVFIFGYNIFSAVFRGMGDSRHPFIFIVIASVTNIVLDLVAVAWLGMGAAGAAAATIASQALSVVLCIIYLKRSDFLFDFKLKSFRIYSDTLKNLLKVSIPTTIQNIITTLSFTVILFVANQLGVMGSAASAIGGRITSFAILPVISLGNAITAMCAQNFGAGKSDRAVRTMWVGLGMGLAINIVLFSAVQLFSAQLSSIFTSDEELIASSVMYLRTFCFDYLAVAVFNAFINFALGTGKTLFPSMVSLCSSVLIRVPASYFFAITLNWGLYGLGLAAPIASAVSTLVMIGYFVSGYWKKQVAVK